MLNHDRTEHFLPAFSIMAAMTITLAMVALAWRVHVLEKNLRDRELEKIDLIIADVQHPALKIDPSLLRHRLEQQKPESMTILVSRQPPLMEDQHNWRLQKADSSWTRTIDDLRVKVYWHGQYAMVGPQWWRTTFFLGLGCCLVLTATIWVLIRYLIVKPTEKALRKQSRIAAIGRGVQRLAHDLKQPFHLVQGLIHQLDNTQPHQASKILTENRKELNTGISEVRALIDELVAIENDTSLQTRAIDLTDVLIPALVQGVSHKNQKFIQFAYEFNHTLKLKGDIHQLRRVFQNIIANAIRAVSDDGEIWFKTRMRSRWGRYWIDIAIGNEGSYISPEDQEKVFEPFMTKEKAGTGLGLAIAQDIVHAHGGKIWVESHDGTPDDPPETEFWLTLPASSHVGSRPASLPQNTLDMEIQTGQLRSVAVIDDDPFILGIWQNTPGLRVRSFSAPEEFLGFCPEILKEVEIIISDFHFRNSEMNAHSLAETLHTWNHRPPLAIASHDNNLPGHDLVAHYLAKETLLTSELRLICESIIRQHHSSAGDESSA